MTQVNWRDFGNHDARAETNHDEAARFDYIVAFFNHLSRNVWPGHRSIYDNVALPKFVKKNKRNPKDRHEVRKLMLKESYFQYWSMMRVFAQANTFEERRIIVEHQLNELVAKCAETPESSSLELNPDLEIPEYQSSLDMHWMPGGYTTEFVENDVAGGAMYDMGGLYTSTNGMLGEYNDGAAYAIIDWVYNNFDRLTQPKRILDVGCTVGHNTLPFKEFWPKAEVIGIDIGAPVLRYADRRAKSLGIDVTFSQQNAECTEFEDNSFDLIVSTMFLHETSYKAVHNIIKENHRLLRSGGLMLHVEQPPFAMINDPFDQLMKDWDTHNNNEPFWGTMHDMDLPDVAMKSGFDKEHIIETFIPLLTPTKKNKFNVGKGEWFAFGAIKS